MINALKHNIPVKINNKQLINKCGRYGVSRVELENILSIQEDLLFSIYRIPTVLNVNTSSKVRAEC